MKASKMMWAASLAGTLALASAPAGAEDKPFRLQTALDAPDWLKVSGEIRGRYETLDGQYRAGGRGGDQILNFRSLFLVEADAGPVRFGVELQDSRAYLDDAGTPLSTSLVNPLDALQAYALVELDGAFGAKTASLKLGRQTLGIGSQRVFERTDFGNAIANFTGAYWRSTNGRGDELHALYVVPLSERPSDRTSLNDNKLSGDEEQWGRRTWLVQVRHADAFAQKGLWAEAYLFGLNERDETGVPTPNRDYVQAGVRFSRSPKAKTFDFDVEAGWRTGERRATSAATDTTDLDVSAGMLYAHVGYSFDHAWKPRLALDYYFASGDESPTDGEFGQFERLFGARRNDLGATGIYGPLIPANINAPGARFEFAPTKATEVRLGYKAFYLAEERDSWVAARVQDPAGASGRFVGHSLEARGRAWLVPNSLRLEVGAAALLNGEFADTAPNRSRQGDTGFGYLSLTQQF